MKWPIEGPKRENPIDGRIQNLRKELKLIKLPAPVNGTGDAFWIDIQYFGSKDLEDGEVSKTFPEP
jgi:hypothetical protein